MSKTPRSKGFILYKLAKSGNIILLRRNLNERHYTDEELNWKTPGNGLTPLLIACQENHPDCVKKLVETEGVDVNAVDKYGRTSLFIAAEFGYPHVVRELLVARNIDIKKSPTSGDNIGKTPLKIAKSYKNIREHIPTLLKSSVEFENYKNIEEQIEELEIPLHLLRKKPTGGRGSISRSNKRKSTNLKYKKNRKTKRSRR